MVIEVLAFLVGAALSGWLGYRAGYSTGRSKAVVIPVAKVVHERVMPSLTREQRRAHKRRKR